MIKIQDITKNESDFDKDSDDEALPRGVKAHVFEDSHEYRKALEEKWKHYLEQNVVLYPKFKDFPNQIFVTKWNGEKGWFKVNVFVEKG